MPGQFNPFNPAGGLKPGQGFNSRGLNFTTPGAAYLDAAGGTTWTGPGTVLPGTKKVAPAGPTPLPPGFKPNSSMVPGARAPYGQSGRPGYAPTGRQAGDFVGGPTVADPYTMEPSSPGVYGTGAAGSYVDAQGRHIARPFDPVPAPGAPPPSGLSALAQLAWPPSANSPTAQGDSFFGAPGGGGFFDWFIDTPAAPAPPVPSGPPDVPGSQYDIPVPTIPSGTQNLGPLGGTTGLDILSIIRNPDANVGTLFPGAEGEDVFGLPGRSKSGEAMFRALMQLSAYLAQQQQARGQEREGIFRDLAAEGPASAPYGLAMDAAGAARNRLDPASLERMRAALTGTAQETAAQGRSNALASLRDAGMFGAGGVGTDPVMQAENLAAGEYGRSLRDIELAMSAEEANRIKQGSDVSQDAANVYQNLGMIPRYNLATALGQNPNQALLQLMELMNQIAQTAVTGDVAHRNAPSDFERIGLPIIGGVLGSAGDLYDILSDAF